MDGGARGGVLSYPMIETEGRVSTWQAGRRTLYVIAFVYMLVLGRHKATNNSPGVNGVQCSRCTPYLMSVLYGTLGLELLVNGKLLVCKNLSVGIGFSCAYMS